MTGEGMEGTSGALTDYAVHPMEYIEEMYEEGEVDLTKLTREELLLSIKYLVERDESLFPLIITFLPKITPVSYSHWERIYALFKKDTERITRGF